MGDPCTYLRRTMRQRCDLLMASAPMLFLSTAAAAVAHALVWAKGRSRLEGMMCVGMMCVCVSE